MRHPLRIESDHEMKRLSAHCAVRPAALGRYFGDILLIRSSACGIVETRQPFVAELSRAVATIIIFCKLH